MEKGKAIMILLRLPFLTVTIGAVLLGSFYAYWENGSFNLFHFVLTILGAAFMHIATNVANDYFDFKSGNDAANISGMAPFSGGSRMVLEGFVSPRTALAVSLLFACLGAGSGLYLNFIHPGNVVLYIGIAGMFFVFAYNGVPLRLVNIGLGEIAIFLAWGPLMVLGAYYVQAGGISSIWPLIISLPSGLLTTMVLLINEFADKDADASVGRRTWVILLGNRGGLILYLIMALSCYFFVAAGVILQKLPIFSLLVFLTIGLPFTAYKTAKKNLQDWKAFMPAVKTTVMLNTAFLTILSVVLLLSK